MDDETLIQVTFQWTEGTHDKPIWSAIYPKHLFRLALAEADFRHAGGTLGREAIIISITPMPAPQQPHNSPTPKGHEMHCKNCTYFDLGVPGSEREFLNTNQPPTFGQCNSEKFVATYSPDDTDWTPDMVVLEVDEGWSMYVGPEFGCLHWREKDV